MIRSIHNELHPGRDHTELPDDQFVASKVKMICYVLLEVFDVLKIIVIGIISDDDVGIPDDVFEKT